MESSKILFRNAKRERPDLTELWTHCKKTWRQQEPPIVSKERMKHLLHQGNPTQSAAEDDVCSQSAVCKGSITEGRTL